MRAVRVVMRVLALARTWRVMARVVSVVRVARRVHGWRWRVMVGRVVRVIVLCVIVLARRAMACRCVFALAHGPALAHRAY